MTTSEMLPLRLPLFLPIYKLIRLRFLATTMIIKLNTSAEKMVMKSVKISDKTSLI